MHTNEASFVNCSFYRRKTLLGLLLCMPIPVKEFPVEPLSFTLDRKGKLKSFCSMLTVIYGIKAHCVIARHDLMTGSDRADS